jgi:ABC-type transport system involved in multi-copper enzyme maturation permease subunit
MQLWALIYDSFRHAVDRKIFWVLIAITVMVVLAMASIGFEQDRISFLFGAWEVENEEYNPVTLIGRTNLIGIMVYTISDIFLGWVGITLMIIATASIFPAMMEPGAVDILLSKPIARPVLFLYKYVASMVFVLAQAVIFVGLTFLVMGLRWGVWAPGYLLTIPLMLLLFSYLYCVSVLVGVYTRSSVAAILVSLAAWVTFSLMHQAPGVFEVLELNTNSATYQAVRGAAWIPPKTGDVPYLAARWSGAGTSMQATPSGVFDNEAYADQQQPLARAEEWEQRQLAKSPWTSIGSSLLFEAFIVFIAMRKFTRQDF